jgi:hypothetical protein
MLLFAGVLLFSGIQATSVMAYPASGSNPFKNVPFTGSANSDYTLRGTITIQKFAASMGHLTAAIHLEAQLFDDQGNPSGNISISRDPDDIYVHASCQTLKVTVKGLKEDGVYLSMDAASLTITVSSDKRPELRPYFCAIAQKYTSRDQQKSVADDLNSILAKYK